ncbi:hypothetical protein MoryE10_00590 [Methylogaea oryzae]|uniref:Uncharacterized protein n=1 Tax=Methylogaea oryzae TaxID=1295382 RepID=A0A8D4VKF5_9GAMM|nr:hypothetical protein MoryE10_00590 [Methylogaea oryzae]
MQPVKPTANAQSAAPARSLDEVGAGKALGGMESIALGELGCRRAGGESARGGGTVACAMRSINAGVSRLPGGWSRSNARPFVLARFRYRQTGDEHAVKHRH